MHSISKFIYLIKILLSVILPKHKISFEITMPKPTILILIIMFIVEEVQGIKLKNALIIYLSDNDIVSIHDGVSFISIKLIKKLYFSAMKKNHAAPYNL